MSATHSNPGSWAETQQRNSRALAAWTAAWVASVALATFGHKFLWDGNKAISLLVILLQVAIGAGMILSNKRLLLGLDEMQQRIQLEAMGVTLGVALVAGIAYSALDATNVIPFDAEIGLLVGLMGITYLVTVVTRTRRFA